MVTHSAHAPQSSGPADPRLNPDLNRETSDVNVASVLRFGAGLIVAAALIHFLVWLLFMYFSTREAQRVAPQYPLAAGQIERLPPEPRLQTNPREELRDLQAQEDAVLGSYGLVDKERGVVRIPIDEAMKLVVQRGLPARAHQEQTNDRR
jgi:hypothetical protein